MKRIFVQGKFARDSFWRFSEIFDDGPHYHSWWAPDKNEISIENDIRQRLSKIAKPDDEIVIEVSITEEKWTRANRKKMR